jgi:hypothetical protein
VDEVLRGAATPEREQQLGDRQIALGVQRIRLARGVERRERLLV